MDLCLGHTKVIPCTKFEHFGWQRECQEDFASFPTGGTGEDHQDPPPHMAKHHPAQSEMSQSYTLWSSRHGSESPSVEVAVDVRRYAILHVELHARNDDDDDDIS